MAVLFLVVGLVVVVGGAELFFEALLGAAARLRISPFILTVALSGFELENLAAGIAVAARGLPDAAAGTFLGGTTFLALAVAGIGAAITPINAGIPRAVIGWLAVAPLPLLALGLDGGLSRIDGVILLGWFAIVLLGLARASREMPAPPPPKPQRLVVVRVLAGLGLLGVGGDLLGRGIRDTIRRFGISETLLGNTAVAASIEGEELIRVVVPAKRGRGELAIANIVGTIAHFVAFNAGVIAIVHPLRFGTGTRWLHLPVATISPMVLAVVLLKQKGIHRLTGIVLACLYAIYVVAAIIVAVH